MKRFRLIGAALLTVFAIGTAAASVAQAEEAPFWAVEGSRLKAGQTRNITAKVASAELSLSAPEAGIVVACKKAKLNVGVLLGSEPGESGKNDEVAELTECGVTGNGAACTLPKPIVTEPLSSELVENVENARLGKRLLIEFFPTTGSLLANLEFGGTCTNAKTKVTGKVAAEVLVDPGEEKIELGGTPKLAKSWLIEFPKTSISEVWLIKGGLGKAVPVGLSAFAVPATEEGTVLVLLVNGAEWSPLP